MDATAVYRYDASGNRVMKISGGTITYYVLGGEYVSGTWQKLSSLPPGRSSSSTRAATTYFFHADHLGTHAPRRTSPGRWSTPGPTTPMGSSGAVRIGNKDRYTGKERDTESANDYFGARYYWNGAGGGWEWIR